MKITLISGSHRQPSQSRKVADFMAGRLAQQSIEHDILDLGGNPLPLWEQSIWDDDPQWLERLAPIRQQCASSDAFVVIAPEWHGQVPAGLKNLFLLLSKKELGHKPALIVAVSSGGGGSYPVAELRMSSYKNNRICYLPEHLIIRDVENVLNEAPNADHPSDTHYRNRIDWNLNMLQHYAVSLKQVREGMDLFPPEFGNGM